MLTQKCCTIIFLFFGLAISLFTFCVFTFILSLLSWRKIWLHLKAPVKRSGILDLNGCISVDFFRVNQGVVYFVTDEEGLNSPHGDHELNELAYEHWEHADWRLNQIENSDDGVSQSEVHRVFSSNKGCEGDYLEKEGKEGQGC